MLFASHRIEEVTTLAKRVVSLERGRITSECPAAHFAEQLGVGSVLHLTLSPAVRDLAMVALRTGGFTPRLNGVGLLVPVPPEQKAAPFRLLAEARIAIDDFELIAADHARAIEVHS
jgi:ABC-type molybdate transport system ATPase subunit